MLGLYIHVPFCVQKCNYCDFNSFKIKGNDKKEYLNAIEKEMKLYSDEFKNKQFDSVFFGGGTPSILNIEELKRLVGSVFKNFNIKQSFLNSSNCVIISTCFFLKCFPYFKTTLRRNSGQINIFTRNLYLNISLRTL